MKWKNDKNPSAAVKEILSLGLKTCWSTKGTQNFLSGSWYLNNLDHISLNDKDFYKVTYFKAGKKLNNLYLIEDFIQRNSHIF